MTDTNDAERPARRADALIPVAPPAPRTPASPTPARKVLVVDADRALLGLLEEWLADAGCMVATNGAGATERFDAVIVDVPFPRNGGVDSVARIAATHPHTPILALSSTFFAGIECRGAIAHRLGVSCVLPKPASRAALIGALAHCWARPEPAPDTIRE